MGVALGSLIEIIDHAGTTKLCIDLLLLSYLVCGMSLCFLVACSISSLLSDDNLDSYQPFESLVAFEHPQSESQSHTDPTPISLRQLGDNIEEPPVRENVDPAPELVRHRYSDIPNPERPVVYECEDCGVPIGWPHYSTEKDRYLCYKCY